MRITGEALKTATAEITPALHVCQNWEIGMIWVNFSYFLYHSPKYIVASSSHLEQLLCLDNHFDTFAAKRCNVFDYMLKF